MKEVNLIAPCPVCGELRAVEMGNRVECINGHFIEEIRKPEPSLEDQFDNPNQ